MKSTLWQGLLITIPVVLVCLCPIQLTIRIPVRRFVDPGEFGMAILHEMTKHLPQLIILVIWGLLLLLPGPTMRDIGFVPGGFAELARTPMIHLAVVLVIIGAGLRLDAVIYPARFETILAGDVDRAMESPAKLSPLSLVLVAGLFATTLTSIAEEVAFRGYLYSGLVGYVGMIPAAVLSSALFGVVHGFGPGKCVAAGMTGLAICYIRCASGSIWPCIVLHAVINAHYHSFVVTRLMEHSSR